MTDTSTALMRYAQLAKGLPPAGPMAREAQEHWKNHHPRLHHQLSQAGQLDNASRVAEHHALNHYTHLTENGADPQKAMEDAKARYIYLTDKDGEPQTTPADRHLGREQQVESFQKSLDGPQTDTTPQP